MARSTSGLPQRPQGPHLRAAIRANARNLTNAEDLAGALVATFGPRRWRCVMVTSSSGKVSPFAKSRPRVRHRARRHPSPAAEHVPEGLRERGRGGRQALGRRRVRRGQRALQRLREAVRRGPRRAALEPGARRLLQQGLAGCRRGRGQILEDQDKDRIATRCRSEDRSRTRTPTCGRRSAAC